MKRLPTLLTLGFCLALGPFGCKPTVTSCDEGGDQGADLPDPAFEEQPTQWTLGPQATIDETRSVCGGTRSLRFQLDHGLGSTEVTRSPYFTGVQTGKEYEVRFHYRYENGAAASLFLQIGNYEKHIKFEGSGDWGVTSMLVTFASEPAWIDIYAGRMGSATDFEGSQYDNNLIWVDDFTID